MATYGRSSSSDPTRMVTLKTSDGEEIKVPVAIAMKFVPVREFFMGDLDRPEVENAAPFPLSNVDSLTLAEIVFFNQRSLYFRSKLREIVEKEPLWELLLKYWPVEKEMQEFEAWFFGRQSDESIVKLVKAADFLENKELLDSVMPSFRKRFGLGDDKGVGFVYTAEVEAILLRRAASASGGPDFEGVDEDQQIETTCRLMHSTGKAIWVSNRGRNFRPNNFIHNNYSIANPFQQYMRGNSFI